MSASFFGAGALRQLERSCRALDSHVLSLNDRHQKALQEWQMHLVHHSGKEAPNMNVQLPKEENYKETKEELPQRA